MFVKYIDGIRPPKSKADHDSKWVLEIDCHGFISEKNREALLLMVDRLNPSKTRIITAKWEQEK